MANDTEKRVTAKFILDSTGFNESLQGVNSNLRQAQSELKNANASVGAFGKSSDNLKSVQQALSNQLDLQEKKVDIYRQSIEKTTEKMQSNISERDKLKTSLDNANKAYDDAIKQYGKESTEAQKTKESVSNLEDEYNKKQKAIESNAKSINNYTVNLNKANAELAKTQGQLNKTTEDLNKSNSGWINASENLKSGSESFKKVGEGANSAGDSILELSVPLVGVGIAAAKVGMDFDSQMSRVKAISGATGEEFQKLNDQAISLGASTAFSAKEAAQGMENLASAGFSTNEIMAAMPGMLDLAASSGEDLASSADIAASTLRGFGLAADQAGHVADVLAKNSAATNAAVGDTGEAMKYIAPVAHSMGLSLEEVTAAIGEMANAGIKGSDAGTTLRGSLVRLASPSKEAADLMKKIGFNAFDANGKILPLNDVVNRLQKATKGMTDEQKQNTIATIFGTESLSGMLALIQAGPKQLNDLTASFKNSKGAASEMAKTMQDNAKSSVEQMMGSLETAGIKLEQGFAPTIRKVADSVGNLADKFASLSPETQSAIVKAVGLTVAVGGTLKVVGGLANSVGSVLGVLSKFSGAVGAAKVATEGVGVAAKVAAGTAGAGGVAGLGSALGSLAIAAGPWLLAGGLVAGTGYAIYKGLTQQALPSVDLFKDKVESTGKTVNGTYATMGSTIQTNTIKISNATKQAVGAYLKLDNDAKNSLMDLFVNGTIITDQTVTTLVEKYNSMGAQIKAGLDTHYNEEYTTMQQFFQKSSALSTTEETTALANLQKSNTDKKAEIDNYTKQIQDILQKASAQKRELTTTEQQEINGIQDRMRINAVNSLSQGEVDSKVILERLKDYGSRITAEQASAEIQNANKARDGSISAAKTQYDKTVAQIIRMRDESHSITSEQADKLIADAARQRDESITKAGELRDGVVERISNMNKDVLDNVDTNSGKILTIWDKLKNWWNSWVPSPKTFTITEQRMSGNVDRNWTGNNYFGGGLTALHDTPGQSSNFELYDLPRGTRIYNHDASEELVLKTAESVANKVANSVLSTNNRNGRDIKVNQNIYVPVQSPSEIARQTKNSLKELGLLL